MQASPQPADREPASEPEASGAIDPPAGDRAAARAAPPPRPSPRDRAAGGFGRALVWSDVVRGEAQSVQEAAPEPGDPPARGRPPRAVVARAAAETALPRRRAAEPVPAGARVSARAAAHGRGRPIRPAWPGAGAPPARADGPPPLAVQRTLLQFLPYEEAAPRLAVPVSLEGDVLTVAVALPSVDLSVITDRSPWLRIEREVTGYHRIVQALREVQAMREAPGRPADAGEDPHADERRMLAHVDAGAGGDLPGTVGGWRARLPGRGVRPATRLATSAAARLAARGEPLVPRLTGVDRARRRRAAAGALTASAATAALVLLSAAPSGADDPAARAALDTAACAGALVTGCLALLCYRMRRTAASLALVLALGAFAFAAVLTVAGLAGSLAPPRPERASGVIDVFAAATSTAWLKLLGALALAAATVAVARHARRSRDDLLAWCAIGALCLVAAHAVALSAGASTAADVLRLAAIVSFLVGAAREIAAHTRQLAAAAVQAERRRMARELHDGVAQELAYIVSQASSLARNEPPAGPLRSIALAGERALIDSRRSILTLTSPEPGTLRAALADQATQWAERAGLKLDLAVDDDVTTSPEMRHAILRIVQEAISNAVRHSGATKIMVSLSARDGAVTVRISDDGRGLGAQPHPEQMLRGFGLVSMAERAEAFGGQLRLQSEPGRGTVVEVAFR